MDERRQHPRLAHRAAVFVTPYDLHRGSTQSAELRNCSHHGVGIVVGCPLRVGSHFLLWRAKRREVLAAYVVKRCRKSNATYEVGAHLVGIIGAPDEHHLESLLMALISD